jgi:hypothetical protein
MIEESAVEISRCQEEIQSLSYAIANIEIEHEIGKIDDQNYNIAFGLLQETLKRATTEKTDYELIKSKLSGILLGEGSQNNQQKTKVYAETVTQVPTKLPVPPVVVYVKEIGKAGI